MATQRVTIRRANADDIPALFSVRMSVRENGLDLAQLKERGVTPATVAEMLAGDDARTWVAEDAGEIVAFSMADARAGSVFALFVLPRVEGRGFGRALLRASEEWLFGEGWETIWLQTAEEQQNRAHGFYRAAGWTQVGPADHGDVRYEKRRANQRGSGAAGDA